MAFTGNLGIDVDISNIPVSEAMRNDVLLFSESNGRLLVEINSEKREDFEKIMKDSPYGRIGTVSNEPKLIIRKNDELILNVNLSILMEAWKTPLEAR